MKYTYSIANDTFNGTTNADILSISLKASAIPNTLNYIKIVAELDLIEVEYLTSLITSDKTILDGLITGHSEDPLKAYKTLVENAIAFFNEFMIRYAAENITLGITFYNKTKDVADYLKDVMRYGQSGSLYEVVNAIDTLIAAGVPVDLDPFITQTKLEDMKAEVNAYLGA